MKMDVDEEKVRLRMKELVNYDGYLPGLIRLRMPFGTSHYYTDNMMKKGLFDKYGDQFSWSKGCSLENKSHELEEWIKNHPEFKDLIIYVKELKLYYPEKVNNDIPNMSIYLLEGESLEGKEKLLQKWYDEDPEYFNEWIEWAKGITGPKLFEGTSFE